MHIIVEASGNNYIQACYNWNIKIISGKYRVTIMIVQSARIAGFQEERIYLGFQIFFGLFFFGFWFLRKKHEKIYGQKKIVSDKHFWRKPSPAG